MPGPRPQRAAAVRPEQVQPRIRNRIFSIETYDIARHARRRRKRARAAVEAPRARSRKFPGRARPARSARARARQSARPRSAVETRAAARRARRIRILTSNAIFTGAGVDCRVLSDDAG